MLFVIIRSLLGFIEMRRKRSYEFCLSHRVQGQKMKKKFLKREVLEIQTIVY